MRALSPILSAFCDIRWPTDRQYLLGKYETQVLWGLMEVTSKLAAGHDGPLVAIAQDESQFVEVVRADDTSDDPFVYRLDHDGSDSLAGGTPLSKFLAGVKSTSTRPSKVPKEKLLAAVRERAAPAFLELLGQSKAAATSELDKSGFTILHYAAMARLDEAVDALLAAGADPSAQLRSQMTFGKKFRGDTWGASREPWTGEAPLHSALFEDPHARGAPQAGLHVVRALLKAGANPNLADGFQRTPLQIAARGMDEGFDAIVVELLAAGADPNVVSKAIGSALEGAIDARRLDRVHAILARGANPNLVMDRQMVGLAAGSLVKGVTAVHIAARRGTTEFVVAILDAGGDPNVRAGDGTLPLACALPKAAEVLKQRGAVAS